ncbi:MAG: BlaI/MecI/CopY family transcriptional regulator [Hymenobacter sp.]
MAKQQAPRPTDAELTILSVLWQRGACTVREVHESLSESKSSGYTTTLKLMQIMVEKNLVERDEAERAHVYRARLPQEQTQRQLLGDLLERALRRLGRDARDASSLNQEDFQTRTRPDQIAVR